MNKVASDKFSQEFFIYNKFPKFNLKIIVRDNNIIAVEFLDKSIILRDAEDKHKELKTNVILQLDSYLNCGAFKFNLPLLVEGTSFQKKVWNMMQDITPGATISYSEAARKITSGARAIGRACGLNRLPVFIPCHRITAINGGLGGFMQSSNVFNLEIKQWLLNHERLT